MSAFGMISPEDKGIRSSISHTTNLQKVETDAKKQLLLKIELDKLNQTSNVPIETRAWRADVVRMVLSEGISFNALRTGGPLRGLLERGAFALGGKPDLAALIPFIRKQELDAVVKEMQHSPAGIATMSFRPYFV